MNAPLLFDDIETFPLFAGTPIPAEPATFQPADAWRQLPITGDNFWMARALGRVTIHIPEHLAPDTREIVEHAAQSFLHLVTWHEAIGAAELADRIAATYDMGNPRTAEVVHVLRTL